MKKFSFVFSLFLILLFININFSQNEWLRVGGVSGLGMYPNISVSDSNTIWVTGLNVIAHSTNGGLNFTNAIGNLSTNGPAFTCIWGVDANTCFVGDSGTFGGSSNNAFIYKTTDGGVSWSSILSTGPNNGSVCGITFSRLNPDVGICVSNPPTGPGGNFWLQKTTDGGVIWILQSPPGITNSVASHNSVFVIDEDFYGFGTRNILNNLSCYVVYTTDGGNSWNNKQLTIIGTAITGIAVSFDKLHGVIVSDDALPHINTTPDAFSNLSIVTCSWDILGPATACWVYGTTYIYVGGDQNSAAGSIEESSDGGASWNQQYTDGVAPVPHLDVVINDNKIFGYAITGSIGYVLKMEKSLIGIKPINSEVPQQYKLYQNYPNPFNPATKIKFNIPNGRQMGLTSLNIYDILGREVATLVNEKLQPGSYELNWNASNFASGIYLYRLISGDFTQTNKLILLK